MKKLNRRQFLGNATVGLGSALILSKLPLGEFKFNNVPVGFQTWIVREDIAKDFPGTMKKMAGMGYKITELCSPPAYADSGFGGLVNIKPADLKKIINDAGLECPSCHFGFSELTDKLDDRIEFAKGLGLTQMICSSFGLPKTATIKDYEDAADKLNKAGEKIKSAGMQAGFHNHEGEFHKIDDKLIYDALMNRFDPSLVKMQFQTQVITLGFKASDYFKKFPGRFISSHLSDWTPDKKQVPIGQGIIDWKEFFAASKTGGVKNFFVEMDLSTMKESVEYIKAL